MKLVVLYIAVVDVVVVSQSEWKFRHPQWLVVVVQIFVVVAVDTSSLFFG